LSIEFAFSREYDGVGRADLVKTTAFSIKEMPLCSLAPRNAQQPAPKPPAAPAPGRAETSVWQSLFNKEAK